MKLPLTWCVLLTLGPGLVGCGGDPVDAAGAYTANVTNRDNGCNLANWQVGNSAAGIGITITQSGAGVTATVDGVAGGLLSLALGSNVFTGEVDGSHLAMVIVGTRAQTTGNCTFTYDADLEADLDGDVLTGTLSYRAATNDQSDCAPIEGCVSRQDFNGARPPT
ncbi:MAG: hypothetical protein KBG28_19405 [Kofleriaceae bacterium]|jgi:hypothetical protein|nr:hypothetical protein [Kofleriaceae bacterium]MBP6835785.1 hypothetical protein [Kofleriaceae bacterium]MBP9206149.1 hypothetical protein [Kofleriaceae bacterium]